MKKSLLFALLISIESISYAWVCPTNFTQIAPGDTQEQIIAACGKPASQKTSQGNSQGPQEWQYYVTINQPLNQSGASAGATPSVKMTIAFVKNKVINMTVQGTSLASTSLCGPTIQIGDDMRSIEKNCGQPVFIQKQEDSKTKPTEIIEYKYNTTSPNTLIFENGILKERR